jgi:hypothetical protein
MKSSSCSRATRTQSRLRSHQLNSISRSTTLRRTRRIWLRRCVLEYYEYDWPRRYRQQQLQADAAAVAQAAAAFLSADATNAGQRCGRPADPQTRAVALSTYQSGNSTLVYTAEEMWFAFACLLWCLPNLLLLCIWQAAAQGSTAPAHTPAPLHPRSP